MASGSLADGQLATTDTAVYTVPTAKFAVVQFMSVFNTNAASQTILIRVTRSGSTARIVARVVLAQNEHAWLVDQALSSITLSDGDILSAQTTTATAVDYLVTGYEGAV